MNSDKKTKSKVVFILFGVAFILCMILTFLKPFEISLLNNDIAKVIDRNLSINARFLFFLFGSFFLIISIYSNKQPEQLLSFDLYLHIKHKYAKHKIYFHAFAGSFITLIIIYGAKLAFFTYTADDYSIVDLSFSRNFFASYSGRWFLADFTALFFDKWSLINPYFNTLLSLCFLNLASLIASIIWGIKDKLLLILLSLLFVASPFMASNLNFNLNTSAHLSFLMASISAYFFIKGYRFFLIAVVLQILVIGIYQTTLQLTVISVLVWYILNIRSSSKKDFISLSKQLFLILASVFVSYLAASYINHLILSANHLSPGGRLADSANLSLLQIIHNALEIWKFTPYYGIHHINAQYWSLAFLAILIGSVAFITQITRQGQLTTWKISAAVLVLITSLYTLKLPLLFEMDLSLRAMLQVVWFLSAFLIMAYQSNYKILKSFSLLIMIALILYSSSLISYQYKKAAERTHFDSIRTNEIVTKIRTHQNYCFSTSDTVNFLIIGTNRFENDKEKKTEMFAYEWSKYKGFRLFTDFKFKNVEKSKAATLMLKLQDENVANYPAENSIFVIDSTAILILDKHMLTSKN